MIVNKDVYELFNEKSIIEVRSILSDLKNDLEKNNIDLRLIVGESYCDVVAASDSLTLMIENIKKLSNHLSKDSTVDIKRLNDNFEIPKTLNTELIFAAQLKLYLDIPEKIFHSIDENNIPKAIWLSLFGKFIGISFPMDKKPKELHVENIVKKLISSQESLNSIILSTSELGLMIISPCRENLLTSLSSFFFLQRKSPEDLFKLFLQFRHKSLLKLLEKPYPSKFLLSLILRFIHETYHHSFGIFHRESFEIKKLIQDLSNKQLSDLEPQVNMSSLDKFIPGKLLNYRIRNDYTIDVNIGHSIDNFDQILDNWNAKIGSELNRYFSDYLNLGEKPLNEIIEIKESILMNQETINSLIPSPKKETRQTELVKSIWATFYQSCFLRAIQINLERKVGKAFDDFVNSITTNLKDYHLELWTEEGGKSLDKFPFNKRHSINSECLKNLTSSSLGLFLLLIGDMELFSRLCLSSNDPMSQGAKRENEDSIKILLRNMLENESEDLLSNGSDCPRIRIRHRYLAVDATLQGVCNQLSINLIDTFSCALSRAGPDEEALFELVSKCVRKLLQLFHSWIETVSKDEKCNFIDKFNYARTVYVMLSNFRVLPAVFFCTSILKKEKEWFDVQGHKEVWFKETEPLKRTLITAMKDSLAGLLSTCTHEMLHNDQNYLVSLRRLIKHDHTSNDCIPMTKSETFSSFNEINLNETDDSITVRLPQMMSATLRSVFVKQIHYFNSLFAHSLINKSHLVYSVLMGLEKVTLFYQESITEIESFYKSLDESQLAPINVYLQPNLMQCLFDLGQISQTIHTLTKWIKTMEISDSVIDGNLLNQKTLLEKMISDLEVLIDPFDLQVGRKHLDSLSRNYFKVFYEEYLDNLLFREDKSSNDSLKTGSFSSMMRRGKRRIKV